LRGTNVIQQWVSRASLRDENEGSPAAVVRGKWGLPRSTAEAASRCRQDIRGPVPGKRRAGVPQSVRRHQQPPAPGAGGLHGATRRRGPAASGRVLGALEDPGFQIWHERCVRLALGHGEEPHSRRIRPARDRGRALSGRQSAVYERKGKDIAAHIQDGTAILRRCRFVRAAVGRRPTFLFPPRERPRDLQPPLEGASWASTSTPRSPRLRPTTRTWKQGFRPFRKRHHPVLGSWDIGRAARREPLGTVHSNFSTPQVRRRRGIPNRGAPPSTRPLGLPMRWPTWRRGPSMARTAANMAVPVIHGWPRPPRWEQRRSLPREPYK